MLTKHQEDIPLDANPTITLARNELLRGLTLATGDAAFAGRMTFALTVDEAIGNGADAYRIDVDWTDGGNRIAGSNPRSVLFGAYRLLRELGFRWIRPGKDGELVPRLAANALPSVHLHDAAGYPCRVLSLDGGVSVEHVLEILEWQTRMGMNGYFMQFRRSTYFFRNWYGHPDNPLLPKGFCDIDACNAAIEAEVKRRGLDFHRVGHGWTCEPLGIPVEGWDAAKQPIPDGQKALMAMIGGKRDIWITPLQTNLCYSNPEVRRLLVDAVAAYAKEHPEVDVIHFWLSDESNHSCECEKCRQRRLSDWYVDMCNAIDDRLTAMGSPARVMLLAYRDTLWAPRESRLHENGRFILMFAPITRRFSVPLPTVGTEEVKLPEYALGALEAPEENEVNVAMLREWQRCFHGPIVDFDYHYMWAHYRDPGYCLIAKVLQEDCRNLGALGMDGFILCFVHRSFFPHGLGLVAMARTLWNPRLTFEEIADEFFRDAYGPEALAAAARQYFEECSVLFHPPLLRRQAPLEKRQAVARTLVQEFTAAAAKVQPALAEGRRLTVPCQRESWEQLALHIECNSLLAKMIEILWLQGRKAAAPYAEALFDWTRRHEMRLQKVFDPSEFQETIRAYVLNAPGLLV